MLIPINPASAIYCDDITAPLPAWLTTAVANNKPFYVSVSNATGVPWEMLAAIHYRETSFSHTNPLNGQGIFQFVNGDGGPYPPGPVNDSEFVRQLTFMAQRIQSDYVYRGTLNYTHRPLQANEPEAFRVQDTLFSYNGRAAVYAQQAATYGFSALLSPYEGSPYVMNKFDCPRLAMGMITQDYGNIDTPDARYGTFTLYARLKGASYWQSLSSWLGTSPTRETVISSQAHISYVGWSSPLQNSGVIGTTGQSKAIEAFRMNGEVEYSSYSNLTGWQPFVNRNMVSGTTGQGRPIQAVKVKLLDALASKYDIYYRVHVSYVGWMEWTKNGLPAGVTGDNTMNIEAIEVQLVPLNWPAPLTTSTAFNDIVTTTPRPPLSISIASHVSFVGWEPAVTDNMISGLEGQGRRIEALKINLNNSTGKSGGISYSAHVAYRGWQSYVSDGAITGTIGESLRVEALRAALTGEVADAYELWYRGYVEGIGWLSWSKNGQAIGSIGVGKQLEAVEMKIMPKNTPLPPGNGLFNPAGITIPRNYSLRYATQVAYAGWISNIYQDDVGGTTGQSRSLETIRIDDVTSVYGKVQIQCSGYVKGVGWMENVAQGNNCGTVGQSKPLQAVKLSLSGFAANKYDIYYKTHLAYVGWQNWVKDNEVTNDPAKNLDVEAIVIKLVEK